jgi:CBS domain containing-hemolysin-like protein
MVLLFLAIAFFLLLLNGFFVLAEFAAVKMRPSRVEELVSNQVAGAGAVKQVQDHLDEYLSVCQLGITFASIGLGFVAEPAVVKLIEPLIGLIAGDAAESKTAFVTKHGIAFAISYLIVSYLHILVGELVPKTIAIRLTEAASLWTAKPLIVFRWLFYVPLRVLNGSASMVLKWIGLRDAGAYEVHSEDELRILLSQSHSGGVMSFRRLLFAENVFDLGELKAKDAMRVRSQVQCLREGVPWSENQDVIRKYRFSRYPLLAKGADTPLGVVHIKDLMLSEHTDRNLRGVCRQYLNVKEDQPLETLLSEMQRKRLHVALVHDPNGRWTGFLTLEDVIEEIIGTIRDEFEDEEQINLYSAIDEKYVHLSLEGQDIIEVVRAATMRTNQWDLPVSKEQVVKAIDERERIVSTYLGKGLAMPHARLAGLQQPVVMFIRSEEGVPYRNHSEKAYLVFVLLTPAGQPRVHQRLQSIIATIMDESEYIPDHLKSATSPAEVVDILKTGEQASLD